MMLDDAQRKTVADWIASGAKLSEIQNRLASELGLRLTYMDVRLLVDDLKLTPRDVEQPKPPAATLTNSTPAKDVSPSGTASPKPADALAATGKVSVAVDQLAKPGAMVSGKVAFSDGNKAEWYIDQTGRLGLVSEQAGYRPSATDIQQFQMALEAELSKQGLT
jgi:hypothetical protein